MPAAIGPIDGRATGIRGVRMWSVLKHHDLTAAERGLEGRRADLLRRHAEELEQLDADRAEIDALRRLAATFSGKFRTTAAAVPPPAAPRPAALPSAGGAPPRDAWRAAPRQQPRTNFALFSGAVSRAIS